MMENIQLAGRNRHSANLRPWQGAIIFTVALLLLIFVAAPMQAAWGLWGLVATELLMLALALLSARIFRGNLRIIFPLKPVTGRQLGGVIVLYIGSMLLMPAITSVIMWIAPQAMSATANGLYNVLSGPSLWLLVLISALLPAICEESLMRGVILSSLRPLGRRGWIALIVGLLFGILHLDPVRFLPTAILGTILAVIMLETENLLLPAMFHFINNFIPAMYTVGLSQLDPALVEASFEQMGTMKLPLTVIGVYCFLAAVSPWLLRCGTRLLRPYKTVSKPRSDQLLLAAVTVFFGAGVLCFVLA